MNIGILQCGQVQEHLVPEHGQYPEMFVKLLKQADPSLTFSVYDAKFADLPSDIDRCDAYLITGSRHGVNDDLPWIPRLEHFIRDAHAAQKNDWYLFRASNHCQSIGWESYQIPKWMGCWYVD